MAEDGISIAVEGVKKLFERFDEMADRADEAAKEIVAKSAALAEQAAKANFEGAHKKGEPHVGGNKPNVVTGTLRRSIRTDPITQEGRGVWATKVAPRTVYARRVELGYRGGRGYAYFSPGVKQVTPKFEEIAKEVWRAFITGR